MCLIKMSTEEVNETVNSDLPSDPEPENLLKVLIATDIHLGYNEKDPIRGNDSFNTFEEILQLAVKNDVDFILLGGDLFHESKPSTVCYHRCISLLKKYCLGDKAVSFQIFSDQARNFCNLKNPVVNYEDPNLNISIPVFSIHGNHDDATGANQLSAIDILADSGLVNYFGKWTDLTKVEIYPILIEKEDTRLALYGLSHIKDERLSRLFKHGKVTYLRPEGDDEWFSVFVLHQNRAQNRGLQNYIPESVLPEHIDLVVWGHEHDCRIEPERSENGPYITQPGSSVATSLAIGESLPKHVGLLLIDKTRFAMKHLKLNTVRPFIFKDVTITKPDILLNVPPKDYAIQKVEEIVEAMLQEANLIRTIESPKLPLLKLVVNFTDELLMSNAIRVGQQFNDKVANAMDMLTFKLKKTVPVRKRGQKGLDIEEDFDDAILSKGVDGFVEKYFETTTNSLNVLSVKGLCEAVNRYIDRNDTDALEDIYRWQFSQTKEKLSQIENTIDETNIEEYFKQLQEARNKDEEIEQIAHLLNNENRVFSQRVDLTNGNSSDEEPSNNTLNVSTSSRGAATRPARGPGSRGGRRARGRAIAK